MDRSGIQSQRERVRSHTLRHPHLRMLSVSVAKSSPDSESTVFETRLLEKQLALFCRFSPVAVRVGIIVGAIVAWLVAADHGTDAVVAWLAFLIFVSIARLWLQAHYSTNADKLDARRWLKMLLAGLSLNGLAWSVPAIAFLPADGPRAAGLAALLVGISATAISSLSSLRLAYATFAVPFAAPIAVRFFAEGEDSRIIASGVLLLMLALISVARRQHLGVSELLRLQLDLQKQIEQRERSEAELRIAKAEAEAANCAKSQFLANMSHELRTPLNGILGMSELLIRTTSGKQLKQAQAVRNAGMRLLRIISDILDISRSEAGTLHLAQSEFSPREITSDVVELLRERANKAAIELRADIDEDVPERLASDSARIQQVLSNLVDNAVKFTERGSVQIRVTARWPEGRKQVFVRWEVIDTGIGIAHEAYTRLFKPFSQLDESATRKHGGTGLGLAICRQLVEALGGSIDLSSTPGQGSTFWFELPCEVVATRETLFKANLPTRETVSAVRVLVVEDNPMNCELVVEMLQTAGCHVSTAPDGEQALSRLSTESFDLVLMDWHMPIMDGLTATSRLRIMEQTRSSARLPVIALTASVLPGDREACEAAGMDGFLAKPFSYEEIVAIVDHWAPRTLRCVGT